MLLTMSISLDNARLLFADYLTREKRASPRTVAAYDRDLVAFICFLQEHGKDATPDKVDTVNIRAYLARISAAPINCHGIQSGAPRQPS